MNTRKWIPLVVTLLMIGGAAALLIRFKQHQKLGPPGVKTDLVSTNRSQRVLLPETVLDYKSEPVDQEKIVLDTLPEDTSFGSRRYVAPDEFWSQLTVVMMGTDRTSLHKPQFCLEGAGWSIDSTATREETIRIERPTPYDLPVTKVLVTRNVQHNGQVQTWRGVYVYWFVAEDSLTARHWERMWWMARELLATGVLQRWAYVSFFSVCPPGREEATFERMKTLIAASVPEFQLTPQGRQAALAADR